MKDDHIQARKINFLSLEAVKASEMTTDDWEEVYNKKDPWKYLRSYNERIRNQILIDLVKWSARTRGLDIACGEGTLTKSLSPFIKSIEACDISERALEIARQSNSAENISYSQFDLKNLGKIQNTYDFILCAEIITFLSPVQIDEFFKNVSNKLEPGGIFILTTRSDEFSFFTFDVFLAYLQSKFTVVNVVPVWRPEKAKHRFAKRLFSIFEPWANNIYKAWLTSMHPKNCGMNAYVCINK